MYTLGGPISFVLSLEILFLGNALRYCDDNGVWSRTDVLSCASRDFGNLLNEVMIV